jgi:hypothetical protein
MLPGLPAKLNYFVERASDHLTPDHLHHSDRLIETAITLPLTLSPTLFSLGKLRAPSTGFQQCATYFSKPTTSEQYKPIPIMEGGRT